MSTYISYDRHELIAERNMFCGTWNGFRTAKHRLNTQQESLSHGVLALRLLWYICAVFRLVSIVIIKVGLIVGRVVKQAGAAEGVREQLVHEVAALS